MRITQSFLFQSSLSNLQRNLSELGTLQEQAITGKKFQFASQDPIGFSRVAQARSEKLRVDQYLENVDVSRSLLTTASAAIQDTSNLLNETRPNILAVINGTASDEAKSALASDLKQLRRQLISNANTRFQDTYLFGGTRTSQRPFVLAPNGEVQYRGDEFESSAQIGPGLTAPLGLPGSAIFTALGPRDTTFEGSTGLTAGTSGNTGVGFTTLDAAHTATFYGDESLGGNGDSISGVRPGTSAAADDTVLGPTGNHHITLSVAADGTSGTVSLNGGPVVSFVNPADDLEVEGPGGERVYLDLTGVTAGFAGDVSLRADGTVSLDGAPPVALDFTGDQALQDPVTEALTHIDSTEVRRAGREIVTYSGTMNIFESIDAMIATLEQDTGLSSGERSAVLRGQLQEFDHTAQSIRDAITIMGSRTARLDPVQTQLTDVQTNLEGLIGTFQDVDITEVVGELSQLELVYQTTLSVSARLLNLNPLGLLA